MLADRPLAAPGLRVRAAIREKAAATTVTSTGTPGCATSWTACWSAAASAGAARTAPETSHGFTLPSIFQKRSSSPPFSDRATTPESCYPARQTHPGCVTRKVDSLRMMPDGHAPRWTGTRRSDPVHGISSFGRGRVSSRVSCLGRSRRSHSNAVNALLVPISPYPSPVRSRCAPGSDLRSHPLISPSVLV
jgi:hypothetical protein